MCSFNAGSSGLIPDAAILGIKYLHHGTVMYLPYVRFTASSFPGSGQLGVNCQERDAIIAHFADFHQWPMECTEASSGFSRSIGAQNR